MPTRSASRPSRIDRRTRPARAERRDGRAALLEAAVEVFAERGYREASVGEIAARAGYSKGALYWHFESKGDLFFALLEESIDEPWRESIELLESAPADQDMAPEASRRFAELLTRRRELLLVEFEYWSQAVRDPKLRRRYAKRQKDMSAALGRAIAARLERLGAPPLSGNPEELATTFICLAQGLAQFRLIDPEAVPDHLFGDTFALVYAGHMARAAADGA
jgi:AcrR family transcriptional regulator